MNPWARCVAVCLAFCLSLGAAGVRAEPILYLAANPTASPSPALFTLSRDDATLTFVGDFGVTGFLSGLAYDARNDVLYGTNTLTGTLHRIDRSTGRATLVGPLGAVNMHALAFDNQTGTLYGAYGPGGPASASLFRIDTETGQATRVGPLGFQVAGLAFSPFSNLLFGSDPSTGRIVLINPATGAATPLARDAPFQGIAIDPETNTFYGVSNGFFGLPTGLYTFDPFFGNPTLVGSLPLNNPLDIVFVPSPASAPAVPEPHAWALFAAGAAGGLGWVWRRRWLAAKSGGDKPRRSPSRYCP